MHVTKHARRRIVKLVGMKKSSTHKDAQRAWKRGIRHNETEGSLRRYIDYLYLSHRTANNIRIYNSHVYLFAGQTLVTVIPLPDKYREIYDKEKEVKSCKL